MTTKLTKLVAAAALTMAVAAPSFAMQSELNMLTGSVFNELSAMDMDTASMTNLTLGEINLISNIVHSSDTESEKRAKIGAILRRASDR